MAASTSPIARRLSHVAWWVLLLAMWGALLSALVIFWWYNYFLDEMASFMDNVSTPLENRTKTGWFDDRESTIIFFTLPPLVLAMLATLYFAVRDTPATARWPISRAWSSVMGIPIVLPRPFPVMTVGSLLCYAFVLLTCGWGIWMWCTWGTDDADLALTEGTVKTKKMRDLWALENYSGTLGWVSFWPFWLLFYPVTRRSVLLQITGIQYEQAVTYHRWLAHIALGLAIVHSILMYVAWAAEGQFYKTWEWAYDGYSNLAGSFCFVIGIAIWVTSLKVFRRKHFEVFYYTHHLFILYVIFYWLHVGFWALLWCMVPLGLYFLDRILRWFQLRRKVQLINLRVLPSGYMSFQVPSSAAIQYPHDALIFVTVPAISAIESHPFTITNISATSPDAISILAKPSGGWTSKLKDLATVVQAENARGVVESGEQLLMARVEGPYFPARSNLLERYDALVLVAGGSGITSFMALLQDLVHRHLHAPDEDARALLPSRVALIWVVREASELEAVDHCRLERVGKHVHFQVLLFVTNGGGGGGGVDSVAAAQQQQPQPHSSSSSSLIPQQKHLTTTAGQGGGSGGASSSPAAYAPMAPRIGGQSWLSEFVLITAVGAGMLFMFALFYRAIVYPFEDHMPPPMDHGDDGGHSHDSHGPVFSTYGKVFVYMFAQMLGIVLFGAVAAMAVVAFEGRYTRPVPPSKRGRSLASDMAVGSAVEAQEECKAGAQPFITSLRDIGDVSFGRPQWPETLERVLDGLQEFPFAGILVSGPPSMQRSLAWECQKRSIFSRNWRRKPRLHYHTYSFDL